MRDSPKYFLEKLMVLPHRGMGTKEVDQAAGIITSEWRLRGLSPKIQAFRTVQSGWWSFCVAATILAGSTLFLFFALPKFLVFAGLLLGIIALLWGAELLARVLLAVAPKTDRNIYVEVKPRQEEQQTMVVMAHYDSGREADRVRILGAINRTSLGKKWFHSTENLPFFLRSPLVLSYLGIVAVGVIFGLSFFFEWVRVLALLPFLVFVWMAKIWGGLATAPFVPGAFDNGAGVAIVMSLAVHFQRDRLKNTRLVFLTESAEEGGTDGFAGFFRDAKVDLAKTAFINFDSVGAENLLAGYGEADIFGRRLYYDGQLFNLVRDEIENNRKFQQVKAVFVPLASNASNLLNKGAKVMTTFTSLNDDGFVSQYHQMTDTIEKVNFGTVNFCRDLLIGLIRRVDLEKITL